MIEICVYTPTNEENIQYGVPSSLQEDLTKTCYISENKNKSRNNEVVVGTQHLNQSTSTEGSEMV